MNKKHSFFLIVAIIFALTLYAQNRVERTVSALQGQLSAVETAVQAEAFDEAAQSAAACLATIDSEEGFLATFIRNETLNAFRLSVRGMESYISEANRTEALAELSRARSQLDAMYTLFFRWL